MMKRVLRLALLGLVVLGLLFFFLRPSGPDVESGSTLLVEVSGSYVEGQESSLLARLLGERHKPFVSLLSTLALAERDERIDTQLWIMVCVAQPGRLASPGYRDLCRNAGADRLGRDDRV